MIRHLPDTTRTGPIKYIDIMLYFQIKFNTTDTTVIFIIINKTLSSDLKNCPFVSVVWQKLQN